ITPEHIGNVFSPGMLIVVRQQAYEEFSEPVPVNQEQEHVNRNLNNQRKHVGGGEQQVGYVYRSALQRFFHHSQLVVFGNTQTCLKLEADVIDQHFVFAF